ncbi:MAG TPA: exosortase/archaeosortase family protein [Patescibacteria group bacterium]|nr:exosortase/archaeosortase family protein [Patescibacteria group bacterium]
MTPSRTTATGERRAVWFAGYLALCAAAFARPLWELARLSLSQDTYSHILLIPFVSAGLVWMQPRRKDAAGPSSRGLAAIVFLAGAAIFALNWKIGETLPAGGSLALTVLSLLFLVWAGVLFVYGSRVFRANLFPLMFLLLMVPMPQMAVDRCIEWLQNGSSDVTDVLFRLTGTPVLRRGNLFIVPQFSIEIAKECSGIRSAVALMITCLLAGYLFLRSSWARVVLLAAALPVLVIKNGVRIVTLTLLSIHVDPGFLTGRLHHEGGFLFFLLGLVILWPVLWWLQKLEARLRARETPGRPASGGTRAGTATALPHS